MTRPTLRDPGSFDRWIRYAAAIALILATATALASAIG
jgi:hypothetical protein